MKNKTLFREYMTGLGELFDKKITDILKNIYWKSLEPFTNEQCKEAFDRIMAGSKWFPKPADIIETINSGIPKVEDKALMVATAIIANLRTNGSRVFPLEISDDLIAIHLMKHRWPYRSWAETVLESELKWWTKEFCESYRAYSESGVPLSLDAPKDLKKIANDMLKEIDRDF